jgi:hypothetical protein
MAALPRCPTCGLQLHRRRCWHCARLAHYRATEPPPPESRFVARADHGPAPAPRVYPFPVPTDPETRLRDAEVLA